MDQSEFDIDAADLPHRGGRSQGLRYRSGASSGSPAGPGTTGAGRSAKMRGSRSLLLAVLALGNAAVAQDSTRTVVVGKEEIDSSGLPSLGDLLQRLPEMGSAANTNVNAGGSGETQLNLRSLGAPRTLVLVDGRRWVPAS